MKTDVILTTSQRKVVSLLLLHRIYFCFLKSSPKIDLYIHTYIAFPLKIIIPFSKMSYDCINQDQTLRDVIGGPVVKTLPSNAGSSLL